MTSPLYSIPGNRPTAAATGATTGAAATGAAADGTPAATAADDRATGAGPAPGSQARTINAVLSCLFCSLTKKAT